MCNFQQMHNFTSTIVVSPHIYDQTTHYTKMQVKSTQMQLFCTLWSSNMQCFVTVQYSPTAKHQWQVFEVRTQRTNLHKTLQLHSPPILYKKDFFTLIYYFFFHCKPLSCFPCLRKSEFMSAPAGDAVWQRCSSLCELLNTKCWWKRKSLDNCNLKELSLTVSRQILLSW